MPLRDIKRDRYELAWSVSENSIFLTDTEEDQPVVSIVFSGPTARLTQQGKLDALQEIINALKQNLTVERSLLGY